jgi:carbon monoxide dehydrogenase subunit G
VANLEGESTADIEAPIERVWELVADVERAPQWQDGMDTMVATERDADGHAVLCDSETDAKVRKIKSRIRFTYTAPTQLAWVQEKGDLKSVNGKWELTDLGDGRTRARYWIDVDLGRLGLLVRGPMVPMLRQKLAGARAGELKSAVEKG